MLLLWTRTESFAASPMIHAQGAACRPSVQFRTRKSLLSPGYTDQQIVSCFRLFRHCVVCARALALANAGSSIAARIEIMAITTSNSINVKALRNQTVA